MDQLQTKSGYLDRIWRPDSVTDLLEHSTRFLRRQYLIFIVVMLCAFASGLAYLLATPAQYTARAMPLIDSNKVRMLQPQQQALGDAPLDSDQVEIQVEILKSEKIAQSVIQAQRLTEDSDFLDTEATPTCPRVSGRGYVWRPATTAGRSRCTRRSARPGTLCNPGATPTARSQSDEAASAERDGEIGWAAEPDLKPEIRKQVVGLAKGGVTDPVRIEDGWHMLKLIDTEAAHTRPLAEVKDALIQRIRAKRAEANRRAYIAELFKQNPKVINEIALSKLFDGNSGATPAR
jgi:hypothetical protein